MKNSDRKDLALNQFPNPSLAASIGADLKSTVKGPRPVLAKANKAKIAIKTNSKIGANAKSKVASEAKQPHGTVEDISGGSLRHFVPRDIRCGEWLNR